MPKPLFSKSRFYEIKELMLNMKRPRGIDIILNPKRHKKDTQCLITQKINDDTHPSKLSWKNDQNPNPTLEKLLKEKKHLAAFHTFLRSEFSEENIEFWLACEEFKSTASLDDLPWKAEKIYQEFIQPMACREINVDHRIREKIQMCLKNPSLCCFNEAQKHVYLLMERDSCPRFLLSDAYLSLEHHSGTLWYV